jgi:Na+(H+)/acetate symporter ActP
MNISSLDWAIVVSYVVVCAVIGLLVKRYIRHIADFALAGRSVGVNMGLAGMTCTGTGMVAMMYTAEMCFRFGFAGAIPGIIGGLASLLVGTTGFMIDPLRKARVTTVPEMLERRFGKRVRWLAGLVVALGGLLNMGIFLRLGGEFLVHATGLDPAYLKLTMISLLAIVVLYTMVGGMVAVVLTNYFQFLVIGVGMLTISTLVVWQTPWGELTKELRVAYHAGVNYRHNEDVRRISAQERIDSAAKSAGPEEAEALREDLQRKNGEALRRNVKQLATQYVLVDTAAATPQALTMGNPVNPAGREGVGIAWLVWQVMSVFTTFTTLWHVSAATRTGTMTNAPAGWCFGVAGQSYRQCSTATSPPSENVVGKTKP